ncbi:MAG: hypothetical protein L0I76_24180 [Pseudonocardia sp.]|nr:hypothetical protein [Pseudonocardia sp.]
MRTSGAKVMSAFVSDAARNRFQRAYDSALGHLPEPGAEHDVATRYGTVGLPVRASPCTTRTGSRR